VTSLKYGHRNPLTNTNIHSVLFTLPLLCNDVTQADNTTHGELVGNKLAADVNEMSSYHERYTHARRTHPRTHTFNP